MTRPILQLPSDAPASSWENLPKQVRAFDLELPDEDHEAPGVLVWVRQREYSSYIDSISRLVAWHAPPVVAHEETLRRLDERVTSLEARVKALETDRHAEPQAEDPWLRWYNQHREELAQYPDSYIAVDLDSGEIVASDEDQAAFAKKLRQLDRRMERLYTTHTSLYR